MTKVNATWISKIESCKNAYRLQVGDAPAVGSDEAFLELEDENGHLYRLQLSRAAAEQIVENLSAVLRDDQ